MKSIVSCVILMISCSIVSAQTELGLLGHWFDSSLPASSAHNNVYNEIWGMEVNGSEIAVIGSTNGTHFIDVTDPNNPTEIHFVGGGSQGVQIIHRDYHDYEGYLYAVADEGSASTLQIIDIRDLPNSVSVVYDSQEYIRRCHNIFIDETRGVLYACYTQGAGNNLVGLRLFDIADPFEPKLLAEHSLIEGFQIGGLHDAYAKDGIAYLNSGNSGIAVADFNDPVNPTLLGSLNPDEYPQSGYNHAGWLSEDGNTYYLADETFGTQMKAIDVSALPEMETLEIPHNCIVLGDLLYASYYYDGLQVFDIADPTDVKRLYFYDTSDLAHQSGKYRGAWGVYPFLPSGNILVSDMQNGLFVIQNVASVGTEELLSFDLNIYPNPSNGVIQLQLPEEFVGEEIQLNITDLTGRVVYTETRNNVSQSIQINPVLIAGTYSLQISSNDKLITQQLVRK